MMVERASPLGRFGDGGGGRGGDAGWLRANNRVSMPQCGHGIICPDWDCSNSIAWSQMLHRAFICFFDGRLWRDRLD